ncbi:hypothetical protein Glove_58g27 [Diversispora epigaea]|uniref:Uncharacterized protein n=1 Tax=Diversispora epigaea TaxID=1348612 RepID=A0A397JIU0_9GLOM|nr:hypothetical protein Glove_58g27 [Diversispora epigaea]
MSSIQYGRHLAQKEDTPVSQDNLKVTKRAPVTTIILSTAGLAGGSVFAVNLSIKEAVGRSSILHIWIFKNPNERTKKGMNL